MEKCKNSENEKMQHIFLRKEKVAKYVCCLCGKDRLEVEIGGQRGEAGCSLLKRQVGKSSANEKHASRFPFWNTIANHGARYPISSFKAEPPAIY